MPKNNKTTNANGSQAESKQSNKESSHKTVDANDNANEKAIAAENDIVEAVNILSLDEVKVSEKQTSPFASRSNNKKSSHSSSNHHERNGKQDHHHKRGKHGDPNTKFDMKKAKEISRGTSQVSMQPLGAASDIVRSGHIELSTLYATNDSEVGRQSITVNLCNAPNNSTLQCGC